MDRFEYEEKRDELVLMLAQGVIDYWEYVKLMNEVEREWEERR